MRVGGGDVVPLDAIISKLRASRSRSISVANARPCGRDRQDRCDGPSHCREICCTTYQPKYGDFSPYRGKVRRNGWMVSSKDTSMTAAVTTGPIVTISEVFA